MLKTMRRMSFLGHARRNFSNHHLWNSIMQNRYQRIGKLIFLGLVLSSARCAVADVINGPVSHVTRGGTTSTSIVAPATVSFFNAYQNATVEITGGEVSWLTMNNNSKASISGGTVSWLKLYDNSSVRITGVEDLSWLVFYGTTSRAEIVANNVQYSNGHLSGNWGNGTFFDFQAIAGISMPNAPMPSNIVITAVPEPTTAALFGLGMLTLAAFTRKRRTVNA